MTHILVIDGHPDSAAGHFCHAIADAYGAGAESAGNEVRRLDLATIEVPFLRSREEQERGTPPEPMREAQGHIAWAEHVVLIYPLWLGDLPALVKAFLEQVMRPGFAYDPKGGPGRSGLLKGKSARIVVTMGMPVWYYRLVYRAHSLKALRQGVLGFCGMGPLRATLVGNMGAEDSEDRRRWLERLHALGAAAV